MADAPRYTDDELLKLVGEERKRSIGFGEGDNGELEAAREKALAYAKGEMKDLPTVANRSKAVDSTVADAIETVLPDIMEVFVGGEDVATFIPMGQDDEAKAQEETDFVQHVVFTENEGFLTLYSAIKDALLTRTGIVHWWWDEEEKDEPVAQLPAGMDPQMMAVTAHLAGQQAGGEIQAEEAEDGTLSLTTSRLHGKVKIKAFPSEDFTVAPDTVSLREATYCAVRDRPRVQDLIARGVDAKVARGLKSYTRLNGAVAQERDEAGETDQTTGEGSSDLRSVEVRDHYIRVLGEDDKLVIMRVTTDSEETTLIDKEEVEQIPFAALTPYIIPHRFYGESVADKLIEVQQIKTVLLRNHLDQIYFALNQRTEVDMSGANDFTISDLLRNEPGSPIRVKHKGTINAIQSGAMNVDTLASMEYAATMAETRSGIVRNAQGLKPDTLHDTASGALALISAAQKRVRMIARIFAETGIKDLYLGVHCLLRSAHTEKHQAAQFKPANAWKEVKPHTWPERCAMAVHIGIGSAGREHDLMVAGQRLELTAQVMMSPLGGQLLDATNAYNQLKAWERAAGSKAPDAYWSNPEGKPPPEPQQDPEAMKVQGQLQLEQQKAAVQLQLSHQQAQADAQTTAQKHQMDAEAAERKAQRDHDLKLAQLSAEMGLKREQISAELGLKREQMAAELQMQREELAIKRELGHAGNAVSHEVGMAKVTASTSPVEPGGDPG